MKTFIQRQRSLTLTVLFLMFLVSLAQAQPVTKAHQKISSTKGGFTGTLDSGDFFGWSLTSLGDLDGDGVTDLAVGAINDGDGGSQAGAVWILFLSIDGKVKSHQKISRTEGGFDGMLDGGDAFGFAIENLDDLDGDGVIDIAVTAPGDDDGGSGRGAIWLLFLNSDGTVKSHQKISSTVGGFAGSLDSGDGFARSIASLGDLDGDGATDIAVGATGDDDGIVNSGAVWVLFLNANGTVISHQKISSTEGGFTGILNGNAFFGRSSARLGDLDDDGTTDLVVGATGSNGVGVYQPGAVWVLFLNSDGTVKFHQKISESTGGFTGILDEADFFGGSVALLGDIDGDVVSDIAVGAFADDDGDHDAGALWLLLLDTDGTVKSHQKISATSGGFSGSLAESGGFGYSVIRLGDLDGNGADDIAVGAPNDNDGGSSSGALWILFLNGNDSDGGIDDLIGELEDLVDSGVLNSGQGNALTSKLEQAITKIEQGNLNAATNKLNSFINQVAAFLNAGILTSEQGQPLIDAACATSIMSDCIEVL